MRLVTFTTGGGGVRIGALIGDGGAGDGEAIVDFAADAPDLPRDMTGLIEGGDAALAAIETAVKSGNPKLAAVALDAKLRCADRFVAEDKKSKARAIYDGLYTSAKGVHIRTAALRGMVRAGSDEASSIVMKPLFGDDRAMQAAAVGLILWRFRRSSAGPQAPSG